MKSILISAACVTQFARASPVLGEDIALRMARELAQMGSYEQAVTECKRFICFGRDSAAISEAYAGIGMACRAQAKWGRAAEAFRAAAAFAPDDSVREERRTAVGVVYLAAGNYSAAEFQFLRLSQYSTCPSIRHKAAFFLGVACLYTSRWPEADEAFDRHLGSVPPSHDREVHSLLIEERQPRNRSPNLAKWLSTFVPGSGQVYAGDLGDGVNSLGLNAAFGYLLLSSLLEGRYQDAFISYSPLFWRYYSGSRHNAARICQERNERRNREHAARVLDALERCLEQGPHSVDFLGR